MKRARTLVTACTALLLAVALSACGGPSAGTTEPAAGGEYHMTAPPSDAGAHNDADTEFAQMMIVHHQGAIEMAELAAAKASTPDVRSLAAAIAAAQGPEIDLMTSWLKAWGEDEPAETQMGGMDHDSMTMDGMDQEGVMNELSGLTGADFDRRFLELMTDHHRGAITMAEKHLAAGQSEDARKLSRSIIDAQTKEITTMTNLRLAL
jgi:uncharacterized protein (DUF305 family)